MRDDWDNLGPARALYEDMATRAAASATGFDPGRDARVFARRNGKSAEIHIVTADEATLDGIEDALRARDVSVHGHLIERPDARAAQRAELAWQNGHLLPPPSDEAIPAPCDQCAHPPHDGHCLVATRPGERCGCGRPTLDVQTVRVTDVTGPIEVRARVAVEPTDRAPFVLRIREGREVVHEAGPFATVTQAWEAMQERGEPGWEATIYERGRVADYRGGRAVFETGPRSSTWRRAV